MISSIRVKPILVVILSSLGFLVGCVDANVSRIAGTWELAKADRVANRVGEKPINDEEESEAKMEVIFGKNGTLLTRTHINAINSEKNGTWRFLFYDEHKKEMEVECHLMDQTVNCVLTFLSQDELEMVPPNMAGLTEKLKFRRSR